MHIDVQSRGFSLSQALQSVVEGEAQQYVSRFSRHAVDLRVRLSDVNGPRGGNDRVCLVQVKLAQMRNSIVASHTDSDLYRAIAMAFRKLERGTRTLLGTQRAGRRGWLSARAVPGQITG